MAAASRPELRRLGRAGAAALERLFPSPCLGCGAPLPWMAAALLLCGDCTAQLRRPQAAACRTCGRPLPGLPAGSACGRCLTEPPPWCELRARFLYLPPLDAVVRALKFGRAEFLAAPLGELLGEACRPCRSAVDVVAAVPLPWPRLLGRGYDQAVAIARGVAAVLDRPLRPLLRRRLRRRQTALGRADRQRNLAGAFAARRGARVILAERPRVLLVDDVMTTGATLRAASAALLRAGAREVTVAVVARTPERGGREPAGG